jgi:LemA protein
MSIVLIVILVIVVLVVIFGVVTYNKLVSLRNRVDNGWSQIDVQLQRRNDLIPNLVETVKGYAAHEAGTLEAVVQARNASVSADTPADQAQADNMLTGALRQLFAVAEAYPDLKANQNFLQLQEELTATEDKVSYARQFYNDTVNKFNTAIQKFPAVLIAGPTGFSEREFYEAEETARAVPQVSFGTPAAPAAPAAPSAPAAPAAPVPPATPPATPPADGGATPPPSA